MSADPTEAPDLPDVATMSYEDARDELVQLVSQIEGGNVPLERAMELWERGEALAAHCQGKLDQAQQRLDAVEDDGDGAAAADDPDEIDDRDDDS